MFIFSRDERGSKGLGCDSIFITTLQSDGRGVHVLGLGVFLLQYSLIIIYDTIIEFEHIIN